MQPVSTTRGDGTRACLRPFLEQQLQAVKTGEYFGDYSTLNSPLGDYNSHLQTEASKSPQVEKKKKGKKVLETGLPEGHVRAQPSGHSIFQRTFIKHLLSFRCVPGTRATAERKTSKVQTLKELTF